MVIKTIKWNLILSIWDFVTGPKILFIGIILSIIYGIYAMHIFWEKNQIKEYKKQYGHIGLLHQFWLNFVCSMLGWFSIYKFISLKDINTLSLNHIILLIIGIIGIIGWLPRILFGIDEIWKLILRK